MTGTTNADDPDSEGFTCSALLMCLFLPGRSKKKSEEEATPADASPPPAETCPAPAPDQPAEQEPAHAPGRAASLEKCEVASLYSGNNIVYDFVAEDGKEEEGRYGGADGTAVVQGWCPSPCFDLPVELIRAGERCGAVDVAASDTPVTAAFVFGDYRRGSLRKMASGEPARHQQHLVRFLSASVSSMPRPPVMPSSNGAAVDGDGEFGDRACVQRQAAGPQESGEHRVISTLHA
ncbi:hypothetical protein ACP4OV_019518 [Aristida adscensionis]